MSRLGQTLINQFRFRPNNRITPLANSLLAPPNSVWNISRRCMDVDSGMLFYTMCNLATGEIITMSLEVTEAHFALV